MADTACATSTQYFVLCIKHFKILRRVHYEFVETIGNAVLRLLVRTVTNVRHERAALEFTADTAINSPGLPPAGLDCLLAVLASSLETLEVLGALLDDLPFVSARYHCEPVSIYNGLLLIAWLEPKFP